MLCTLPGSKSSSTWLDRLHTLKGFNNPNPSNPSNPNVNHSSTGPSSSNHTPEPKSLPPIEQMRPFNLVSNVLSDLFVMDPPNSTQLQALTLKIEPKKGSRKQPNPRICVSVNRIRTRHYSLPTGDDTVSETKNKKLKNSSKVNANKKIKKDMKNQKEKKKKKRRVETGLNLKTDSFSRTEATVIDTSTPGWKSAKILIHKGSIWKVRDKKQFNGAKKKKKGFGLIAQKPNEEPSTSLRKNDTPVISEDISGEPIEPVQIPIIRPKYSKPSVPDAAKSIALHLKVRTKGKKKSFTPP